MATPHFVMKHWDPMIGIDWHMPTIPPKPPTPPPAPYPTFMFVSGMYIFFKPLWKHVSLYGVTVEKGTDIGALIPHFPGVPSASLPLEIVFSSSKSYFGSSKYLEEDKTICLDLLMSTNPNLNCGYPCPTPTGFVITFTTHAAGMTWGDVFAGFGAMFGDWCVQTILNYVGLRGGSWLGKFGDKLGPLGGRLANLAGGKLGPYLPSALGRFAGVLGTHGDQAVMVAMLLFGGPMGMDVGTFGGLAKDQKGDAWTPGGALGGATSSAWENIGRAFGDYLDGEENPTIASPDIRTPAAAPSPQIPNVTNNPPP